MIARNFALVFLALSLTGCVTTTDRNEASKWTIELASPESLPSGLCRIYDERNQLMMEGNLESGKMDGLWTVWGSGEDRYAELSYRQGVRNGPVKMWFTPFLHPEARGRLKLEGTFLNGNYEGAVTRYYPSGTRQCVRLYENGILKSSTSWMPNGKEQSVASTAEESAYEQKADSSYLTNLEGMVTQSLAQAHRKFRQ